MRRIYEDLVKGHLRQFDQMLFLTGPRQSGETTLSKMLQENFPQTIYLNWDVLKDRQQLLAGQHFIEDIFPLNELRDQKPLVILDEIHKYRDWKNYIKGFYDAYKNHFHIIITGSARLDVYQSGGDSLMGRYFQYRIHPFSLRECMSSLWNAQEIQEPQETEDQLYDNLYQFGGFPDPFLKADPSFSKRWQTLRYRQLFYEDIQNISHIQEVNQLEVLANLLKFQTGQLLNRTSLAKKIQVSVQTISRWIQTLDRFYFCFQVKPWSKNVTRSLIKEPKIYMWDWSLIEDEGKKFENFIASHLLKATQFWTDAGLGFFDLYYLRDKDQKEVDFVVMKDEKPWFLVEAKTSKSQKISPSLAYFQKQIQAPHAFQVYGGHSFVNKDCFSFNTPVLVPAKTFLSQLI